jgi:Multidrug resistance efflux pump
MAEGIRRFLKPLIGALVVLLVGGLLVWRLYLSRPRVPSNIVVLSGRIEGDVSAIAPKIAGRIREITVREGDHVEAGQLLVVLDDEQIRAQEEQAKASLAAAEARVRTAQQQIAVFNEQLRQSRIAVQQARTEAEGRVREAEANLAAAEAELAQAEANYALAVFDRDAYTRLARTGAVSERQGRQAESNAAAQAAVVASARRRVEAAKGALEAARSLLSNPAIRRFEALAVEQQISQAKADVSASQAEANRARAQLEEARANREDLNIVAPFTATVATRAAEPGEFANVGMALLTLVDLTKVYLRGYVPEGEIGRVRLDQPARVFLDSAPDRPLSAYVSRIDPEAAFTPENTYFREDRVKQVVGVKLQLREGFGFAKPGMPADGEILVEGTQWPSAKR